MSDRLVVEFYDRNDSLVPVVCVLALHGGDNPSSAATTLSDFFAEISGLQEARLEDLGLLAARFVVWESIKAAKHRPIDFIDVCIVPFQEIYGYQVARVYVHGRQPYVHFVQDEWSSEKELLEAALILGQDNVGPPEELIASAAVR